MDRDEGSGSMRGDSDVNVQRKRVDKTLMGADFGGASAMGCRQREPQSQVLHCNFNCN